jgi:DNA-binding MarR family transcriptional regulator
MAPTGDDKNSGYYLWRTTTKWRAAVDRALNPINLTHAQYMLLASLYGLSSRGTQPSQRELADFSGLEPIYVSKLTRALEQSGLLTRAEHPDDSRALQLTLTEHGTETVRQAIAIVHGLQEELTAPIGGTAGPRHQELVHTLKALLGITPTPGGTSENRNSEMVQTENQTPNQPRLQPPTQALVVQAVAEAQGALSALLAANLAATGTGVTSHEYLTMRVVAFRGPYASPDALRAYLLSQPQLGLNDQGVAELYDTVEAKGWITSDPADGTVRLTDAGAAAHTGLTASSAKVSQALSAGLDEEELKVTHRVLTTLIERAGELRQAG